jgi:hypothetical protein
VLVDNDLLKVIALGRNPCNFVVFVFQAGFPAAVEHPQERSAKAKEDDSSRAVSMKSRGNGIAERATNGIVPPSINRIDSFCKESDGADITASSAYFKHNSATR